MYTLRMSFR